MKRIAIQPKVYLSPMPSAASSRAFTLVEMLVCIGIIVVLAGLSVSVLPKVLAKMDASKTVSSYRNAYMLIQMFAADNDGEIVPYESNVYAAKYGWASRMEWPDIIRYEGYTGSAALGRKKGYTEVSELSRYYRRMPGISLQSDSSIARNSNLGRTPDGAVQTTIRFQQLTASSQTMLLTDGRLQSTKRWFFLRLPNRDGLGALPPDYLEGKTHVLYADGRLEVIPVSQVPAYISNDSVFWTGQ